MLSALCELPAGISERSGMWAGIGRHRRKQAGGGKKPRLGACGPFVAAGFELRQAQSRAPPPHCHEHCYHLSVIPQLSRARRPTRRLPHVCGVPTWVSATARGRLRALGGGEEERGPQPGARRASCGGTRCAPRPGRRATGRGGVPPGRWPRPAALEAPPRGGERHLPRERPGGPRPARAPPLASSFPAPPPRRTRPAVAAARSPALAARPRCAAPAARHDELALQEEKQRQIQPQGADPEVRGAARRARDALGNPARCGAARRGSTSARVEGRPGRAGCRAPGRHGPGKPRRPGTEPDRGARRAGTRGRRAALQLASTVGGGLGWAGGARGKHGIWHHRVLGVWRGAALTWAPGRRGPRWRCRTTPCPGVALAPGALLDREARPGCGVVCLEDATPWAGAPRGTQEALSRGARGQGAYQPFLARGCSQLGRGEMGVAGATCHSASRHLPPSAPEPRREEPVGGVGGHMLRRPGPPAPRAATLGSTPGPPPSCMVSQGRALLHPQPQPRNWQHL